MCVCVCVCVSHSLSLSLNIVTPVHYRRKLIVSDHDYWTINLHNWKPPLPSMPNDCSPCVCCRGNFTFLLQVWIYEGHSINTDLAIRSNAYICTLFKEINCDESFHLSLWQLSSLLDSHFGRYVLQSSSGVSCRTREPTQILKPCI